MHPDLIGEDAEALGAERLAFLLSGGLASNDPRPARYFGPDFLLGGRTDLGLPALSPRILGYWSDRAGQARHPLLIARYADAVWDLTPFATGSRADHRHAGMAIDAYLALVDGNGEPLDQIRRSRRALDLALTINDRRRVEGVRDSLFYLHDRVVDLTKPGLCMFLHDALMSVPRKAGLDEAHVGRIVSGLESLLAGWTDPRPGGHLDPDAARVAGQRLARHHRSAGRQEDARRVTLAYGRAFEREGGHADPIGALARLEQVHGDYLQAGLRDEADRLLPRLRELGRAAQGRMTASGSTPEVDRAEFDAAVEQIIAGGYEPARVRIILDFLPTGDQLRGDLEKWAETGVFDLVGKTSIGEELTRASIGTLEEDREGWMVHLVGNRIRYGTPYLRAALDRMFERYASDPEDFVELLYRSPAFDEDRRPLIQHAIRCYRGGDLIAAIHVLVPQIENTFRGILAKLGSRTSYLKNEVFREKDLDSVLGDELTLSFWGDDVVRYFRAVLTDQRGLGIRHNVCHGLWPAGGFARPIADRLVHILMILSCFEARGGGEVREPGAAVD